MRRENPMAGIYIHIPFCKQACTYCGFYFSTARGDRAALVEALGEELRLQRDFFGDATLRPLETVYFGGGTPSVLPATDIARLLDAVRMHFGVSDTAEVTLEANPDDLDPDRLAAWKQAGVNRLSVGVQSFFPEDLVWMHRAHDAAAAAAAIGMIREAGFDDFSCDLIYGFPLLSDDKWKRNIDRMLEAEVPHLSCYAMTVEDRTPLKRFILTGKTPPLDESRAARQFTVLEDRLTEAGYVHYEISNFAKPGKRARHNSHYWDGTPYLGIGPSAHSFRGDVRQWNVSHNALYVKSIRKGKVPFEAEHLTPAMRLNEYVMTSLRTLEGCDLAQVSAGWGPAERRRLEGLAARFVAAGHMAVAQDRLVLTREGKLFADGIAAALFA